jgi:pyruvate dehydrogenase E1 component alpha subunit
MMVVDPDRLVGMYRCMRLIRRFENKVVEMVNANEIPGTTHEYVGQEAVAAGVCAALRDSDGITSTHRGHGHILAKGGDPRRVMAELFGRADGYNRGRGGSMHIADLALGIYGANGLVGAGTPIACGAALAAKREGRGGMVASFFGDGATNQGVVHEAMNLAAIWKLPVVFVCENNSYAITASIRDMLAIPRIVDRAGAYGFPGEQVDGMDVLAVHAAAQRAVARARAGEGPSLVECLTYRYSGHFTTEYALNLKYRPQEEIDAWKAKDPLLTFPAHLQGMGVLSAERKDAIDREVEAVLDEAIAFSRQSPLPKADEALDGMYAVTYPNTPARGW